MSRRVDPRTCTRCHQPIRWAVRESGKHIALEPGSDQAQGMWVLRVVDVPGSSSRRVIAVALNHRDRHIAALEGELLFQAHAAVCKPSGPASRGTPPPPSVKSDLHQKIEDAKEHWRLR